MTFEYDQARSPRWAVILAFTGCLLFWALLLMVIGWIVGRVAS